RGQKEIMDMFYHLHQKEKLTTVLVTHSMEDTGKYADYVIILNQGKKYMEGKPDDVCVQLQSLKMVHLYASKMIRFIQAFEKRFETEIPFTRQSIKKLAYQIHDVIGVKS